MFGIFFGILCFLFAFFEGDFYAAEKRLVKVAFFPMDGYHVREADGSYGGMDVEYLNAICEYTDWNVEYVECASWEEALQLLSEKKVDLVGSAQYSEERAESYQYADLASGYTFGVIATNPEKTIAYEDFEAMQGITFGMVENYVRKNEFLEYLSDHGIKNPQIRYYESTDQLQQALDQGEIDAFVHTFAEIKEGQRLIGRFAPRPFYYISYPGNEDMMRELNQAVADVKMNQLELESELMNKFYYSRFDKVTLLTTEEKQYLEEKEILKVGYLDGYYPFSYEEDGKFKGLSRNMLEANLPLTGLKLEYVKLDNPKAAKKALQDGSVDLLAYCVDSKGNLEDSGLVIVKEYADIPLAIIMKRTENMSNTMTLATVDHLKNKADAMIDEKKSSILICESQEECLQEVENGQADAALCNGYLAEHLFRTGFQYEDLQIKSVYSGKYSISVEVRESDEQLSDILTKTLADIDSKTISEYMLKENTYPFVNIRALIQNYSLQIIVFLICVVILVIIVARHLIRDEKKIRKLMYKDTSMDIWNLNYLLYWGTQKLQTEQKGSYAIVYLNLAQFRRYNIIYGWNAGEQLLNHIGLILKEQVDEKTEICARNQGDRFVLMVCCTDKDTLLKRLQDIKKHLEKCIFEDTDNRMAVQMGIYIIPKSVHDLQLAVSYANQALEFAGDAKENALMFYDDELEQMIKERHEREKLLESVDIQKDFVAYYQPKVDIRSGEIVGAEALVRFKNPKENGAIKAPGFFVPYYEQTGKITELDFFVCEEVCKMLRRRLDEGKKVVTISCNFSRMHFIRPGFAERFEHVLEKYQIEKELIEVEITETLVMEELQQNMVKQNLDIIREEGIRLSIDDFGAGYSSLGVFEQIPASVVKLDRSFLLNKEDYERQVTIMRGIVNLATDLKAQVVCEGVETDEDVSLMQEIGAYIAQGYYYSKPIPEEEFEERLN